MADTARLPHPDSPEPGWVVRDQGDNLLYRLERQVRAGGEGTVWKASRRVDGLDRPFAMKILLPRHLDREAEETLSESLERWRRNWSDTIERTARLRGIPGIVPVLRVFTGPPPHPWDAPPDGRISTLYLVTDWFEGVDLDRWGQRRPSVNAVANAVEQVAAVIDGIAAAGEVHRDISPANIMIDDSGRIGLIDFAFMRPAGADPTHLVHKAGYTPPRYHEIMPENDRYSFGCVVYFLLTGTAPQAVDPQRAAEAGLLSAGYGPAVASHVAALLQEDAAARPHPLLDWTRTLTRLLGQRHTDSTFTEVAQARNGRGAVEVYAVGGGLVHGASVSATGHLSLRVDPAAPAGVAHLAAGRRGDGTVTVFAADVRGGLKLRIGQKWVPVKVPALVGPIRAVAEGTGDVTAFAATRAEQLLAVRVRLDGGVDVRTIAVPASRVLAATRGAAGDATFLVESRDGGAVAGSVSEPALGVPVRDVQSGALVLGDWGQLLCVVVDREGGLVVLESVGAEWMKTGDSLLAPDAPSDLSCVSHREGLTVAVATRSGIWLHSVGSGRSWECVVPGAATRVTLGLTDTGRGQVVCLADGVVRSVEELPDERWVAS
ncbi:serine/threonine protein kinase [Geodermatophilus sp. SYSU D00779]